MADKKIRRTASGRTVRQKATTLPKRPRQRDAEQTKLRILKAAMDEFAARGFEARIEDIAAKAGANRRMAYFYFGSKEGLYLAAVEATFADLVEIEKSIDIEALSPLEAIDALVAAKFDHYARTPRLVTFLNVENVYKAHYLKMSKRLEEFRSPLIHLISRVIRRGELEGTFREGVDPLELYISITGLAYYLFSNQYTLGAVFDVDFTTAEAKERHRRFIVDLVVSYLRPKLRAGALLEQ